MDGFLLRIVVALVLGASGAARSQDAKDFSLGVPGGDSVEVELALPAPGGDPVRRSVARAWARPSASLEERVGRAQQAGLQLGMRNLEGPARALLLDPHAASPVDRARAAVALAPDLPATRFALASALWREEADVYDALTELRSGLDTVPHHLDSWLWSRAAAWSALASACTWGGLLFLLLAGAASVPALVRDLAALPVALPGPSRLALAGSLLLAPAAMGEGLLGVALASAGLAVAYGRMPSRLATAAAALLVLAGLFPLSERSELALRALVADPVAHAVYDVEYGLPNAADLARVERAGADDPLAAGALALRARREGDLLGADAAFAPLLKSKDPRLLNNAANVRLALGRTEEAIDLYEAAAQRGTSPVVLFNLAQAYGRAVKLEQQDLALAEAQAIGPVQVADLTRISISQGAGAPVDLPVGVASLLPRLTGTEQTPDARGPLPLALAPGQLGRSAIVGLLGAVLALLLGVGGSLLLGQASPGGDPFSAGVARLLQGASGDPSRRMERLARLREREIRIERLILLLGVLVPGAAGVLRRRPGLGLLASVLFAGAASAWIHRHGVVPDPLVLGSGAFIVAALCVLVLVGFYALATGLSMVLREGA